MVQVHKKFTDDQVRDLIEKYLRKGVGRKYLQDILGISKTRFFALVKAYRDNPQQFSIQYVRMSGQAKPGRYRRKSNVIF